MMNVHMINFIQCTTRKFKVIGFQNAFLLPQRLNTQYSGGNKVSKSPNGKCCYSGFSLKTSASRGPGTSDFLNHSLINISENYEVPARVQRRMNILIQYVSFGKLSHRDSYQDMPITSCPLLKSKMCTEALDVEKDKIDLVNVDCSPKYLDPYAGPERDLINFPRPVRCEYPETVRHGFIPESWFQSFYSKIGVTGPYSFFSVMMIYLMSKEVYVLQHDFYSGISVAIMCYYSVKNFGPKLAAFLDKEVDDIAKDWDMKKQMEQKAYEDGIDGERFSQFQCKGQMMLFEIKKQVVAIQLECEYRKRLWEAYNEVVQQLEKELLKQQVRKCIAHKHMKQWVINQVLRGITPDVELAVLKWSISQMQDLASHNQSSSFPPVGRHQESSIVLACVSENSGLGISPQGFHVISEKDEKHYFDEGQMFPLLLQPPDSENK